MWVSNNTIVLSTNISAKFPHAIANIPRFSTDTTSKPSFTSYYLPLPRQTDVLENASAIPYPTSTLTSHIALVLTTDPQIFEAINSNVAFNPPADPGASVTNMPNANPTTTAQIAKANCDHNNSICTYNTYTAVTKQLLHNIIINKVHDKYINPLLKHHSTKYNNVDPIDLVMHLETIYGRIQELSDNKTANSTSKRMSVPLESSYSHWRSMVGHNFKKAKNLHLRNKLISDEMLPPASLGYEELIDATGLLFL